MAHYMVMTSNESKSPLLLIEATSDEKAAREYAEAMLDEDTDRKVAVYVYLLRDPNARVFRVGRETQPVFTVERPDK